LFPCYSEEEKKSSTIGTLPLFIHKGWRGHPQSPPSSCAQRPRVSIPFSCPAVNPARAGLQVRAFSARCFAACRYPALWRRAQDRGCSALWFAGWAGPGPRTCLDWGFRYHPACGLCAVRSERCVATYPYIFPLFACWLGLVYLLVFRGAAAERAHTHVLLPPKARYLNR
jgi:hypothetical protein